MAKNIERIAAGLGAEIVRQVPDTGGGAFGAARLARQVNPNPTPESNLLGSMQEYADELDEIVEEAMRRREISGWLPNHDDFAALEALSEATGQPLSALLDEALRLLLAAKTKR
jgi:hypothetical protein